MKLFNQLTEILVILIIVIFFQATAQANHPPVITFNGEKLDFEVQPILENGQVLVPLRIFCESLGAEVLWVNRTVVVRKGNDRIVLRPDTRAVYKNGDLIFLDLETRLVQGRTFVPLRFLSEAIGKNVNWDNDSKTAVITQSENRLQAGKIVFTKALYELEQPFQRYAAIILRIVERGIEIDDYDLKVIASRLIDLNGDGTKEQVNFMAVPLSPDHHDWFWNPIYFVYRNPLRREVEVVELDGNSPELHKRYINIEWQELAENDIPKIFYSINAPLLEFSPLHQYLLKFDNRTGRFVNIRKPDN